MLKNMISTTRRELLALSALAAVSAVVPRRAQAEQKPTRRTLGRTGLEVSPVGMGVMLTKKPEVVRAALDKGITYFDTARAYMGGKNEEILAEGLQGSRQNVVVATKCHRLGSVASVRKSAEESLRALKTDRIDIFQLHGLSGRNQVLLDEHLEALTELKKAGKIRFAGVSTHGGMVEVMKAAAQAGIYDTVLTTFNIHSSPDVLATVAQTGAAGLGVIAMKVMSGGYGDIPFPGLSPLQSALRWVLQQQGIVCAVPSMTSLEQVDQDSAVMGTTYSWRDRPVIALLAAATCCRFCRGCGACLNQCPRGMDIPRAMRAVMYADDYGEPDLARETLTGLTLACDTCGSCPVICIHRLPVGERMARAGDLARGAHA